MNKTPLISATELSRAFRGNLVFRSLSVEVFAGERVLLLGANGVGKSTLLRILAGLLDSDSGKVELQSSRAYLGHKPGLYGHLSIEENLIFFSGLTGASKPHISEQIKRWDLEGCRNRLVAELSKGQVARAGLARVMLGNPELLILDEPTSALDDRSCQTFCQTLLSLSSDRGVIIASHDISRLKEIATRVVILTPEGIRVDTGVQDTGIEGALDTYREVNR